MTAYSKKVENLKLKRLEEKIRRLEEKRGWFQPSPLKQQIRQIRQTGGYIPIAQEEYQIRRN